MSKEIVLITGATGMVAVALREQLNKDKYEIRLLSRSHLELDGFSCFKWDPDKQQVDQEALKNVDAIIHLAGCGIADKSWSRDRKKEIISSRVDSLQLLYKECELLEHFPSKVISASGIGYHNKLELDRPIVETDPVGTGFLAEVCELWEEALIPWKTHASTNALRFGMVLGKHGGAFKEMQKQFKQGAAICMGSGKQLVSWIHLEDLIRVIETCLDAAMPEVLEVVAPKPCTMKAFSRALADALGKGLFPINFPAGLLRLVLRERADLLLLSNNIKPQALLDKGFSFKYSKIEAAIADLCQ